jgi:hypothetical protein
MSRNASVGDVAGDYDEEEAYLLAPAATITVAMAATATDASAHWRGWGGHGSGCGLAGLKPWEDDPWVAADEEPPDWMTSAADRDGYLRAHELYLLLERAAATEPTDAKHENYARV